MLIILSIIFQEQFRAPPKLSEENKLEDSLDSGESDEEKPKKKRGRPKKIKD